MKLETNRGPGTFRTEVFVGVWAAGYLGSERFGILCPRKMEGRSGHHL